MPDTCTECKQSLIMVDNRGRWLHGCLTCNIWHSQDGERVKLSVADLGALQALKRK
jgi:Zn-finger protein